MLIKIEYFAINRLNNNKFVTFLSHSFDKVYLEQR